MSFSENAIVQSVFPNKITVIIRDIQMFKHSSGSHKELKIGSFIEIESEHNNETIIGILENFKLSISKEQLDSWFGEETGDEKTDEEIKKSFDESLKRYSVEVVPLGLIKDGKFTRGGHQITIPPKVVKMATDETINLLYKNNDSSNDDYFRFSSLTTDEKVKVPVKGNDFFNKHVGVVGSTGSGKSCTVATLVQKASKEKLLACNTGINNSHIVIFDIHNEYLDAFVDSKTISVEDLKLPCWLLSNDEIIDLFVESGEEQSYRQIGVLREAILLNKIRHSKEDGNYDFNIKFSDLRYFDVNEVLQYIKNKNIEGVDGWCLNGNIISHSEINTADNVVFDKVCDLFLKQYSIKGNSSNTLNGKLVNFVNRIESKINEKRFSFLFTISGKEVKLKEILEQFLSYKNGEESNVTRIDLSGLPFEVLSVSISVISRIIFEYGYYYKKHQESHPEKKCMDNPVLIVFEEVHKYAPKSEFAKYKSAKNSIERIVKEGRKYGVSAMVVSQRPSEVSDTILSQCSNYVVMRLSNPIDQEYIKRLLPDSLGSLVDNLPSLQCGEALLVGDAVLIPSIVKIDKPDPEPNSQSIKFLDHWKEEWRNIDFEDLINKFN